MAGRRGGQPARARPASLALLYIAHSVPWTGGGLGGTPRLLEAHAGTAWCFPALLVPAPLRAEHLCRGHSIGSAIVLANSVFTFQSPLRVVASPSRCCDDPTFCPDLRDLGSCMVSGPLGLALPFYAVTQQVKLACTTACISAVPLVAGVEGFSGPPSPFSSQLRALRLLCELCLASPTVAALCPP